MAGSVPATVSVLAYDDGDDAICQPTPVLHDHSAHRIGARPSAAPETQHCVLCHWLQSLQTVLGATSHAIRSSDVHRVALPSPPSSGRDAAGALPARAPPRA
jgi:hypothetical protein